jgi:hypothetical protein
MHAAMANEMGWAMSEEQTKNNQELAKEELTRLFALLLSENASREDKEWAKFQAGQIYSSLFASPILMPAPYEPTSLKWR